MNLLGDGGDSDSGEDVKFTISNDFAKRYDKWRQNEELERLKNKYGKDVDLGSESSTSEEEDEDAVELTKDVEKQFLKTLSALKEKNPKIYDANVRFFEKKPEGDEENSNKKKIKKEQKAPLTIAEYTRKQLIEKGHIGDEDVVEKPLEEMTIVEQERALKESFKDVLKDSDNEDNEEGWGGMFKKRLKTAEEIKKEDEDYHEWLAGQKETIENDEVQKDLKGLHDYWTDPKLDEKEAFLKDYILNKRYLEKEDKDKIPSYEEIVGDSDESSDEFDKKQQQFEHKYNFRFEEPDQEFIKRYPRIMDQSLRKKDDRRKRHREEVKSRKEIERAKKDEELKRLKTLKRMEIMDKIKQLQEITGNEEMPFDTHDVEGDFDPEEHDRRMSQLFNDDYYNVGGEDAKPDCPIVNEDLEIENWDEWDGTEGPSQENNNQDELHCEDPGFIMDCDYDPNRNKKFQEEILESTKGRRRRRRQSRFAAVLTKPKPLFDPKDKTFEKYVDEYYSLDYEDLIGDIPCRFKYRKVVPNDYGLTVEEILAAPDRELNAWASLKKIVKRRAEHTELNEVKMYQKKAKNWDLKKKILPTVYAPPEPEEESETSSDKPKKRKLEKEEISEETEEKLEIEPKKKKQKKLNKESENDHNDDDDNKNKVELTANENKKEKSSKKKKKEKLPENEVVVKPETQFAEDSNDNFKKTKKRKRQADPVNSPENNISVIQNEEENSNRKKKKLNNVQLSVKSSTINDKNKKKEKKKNRNNFKNNSNDFNFKLSDERLRSYGINPKKFKNKNKNKNFNKRKR